jgi:hypothetical protein
LFYASLIQSTHLKRKFPESDDVPEDGHQKVILAGLDGICLSAKNHCKAGKQLPNSGKLLNS